MNFNIFIFSKNMTTPMEIDPVSKNILIVGESGSGKSLFLQKIKNLTCENYSHVFPSTEIEERYYTEIYSSSEECTIVYHFRIIPGRNFDNYRDGMIGDFDGCFIFCDTLNSNGIDKANEFLQEIKILYCSDENDKSNFPITLVATKKDIERKQGRKLNLKEVKKFATDEGINFCAISNYDETLIFLPFETLTF